MERNQSKEDSPLSGRDSGALDKTIERIYERYGTDLPAFFRDAYKEAALKCRESVSCEDDERP